MQEEGAKRLELLAPLRYSPAPGLIPFRAGTASRIQQGKEEDCFFCFGVDETQGQNIEPDPRAFLGPLLAAGSASPSAYPGGSPAACRVYGFLRRLVPQLRTAGRFVASRDKKPPYRRFLEILHAKRDELLELPRGRYLFAQERVFLERDGLIRMAVEIQKDGLWERLRLENRLYVRYLYEDGGIVTQVFRPYSET
ncbi:MAG: hypothetical protein LBB77_09025 [Treponema sp.]|nr:hypothetical protein [Treponema sp.]